MAGLPLPPRRSTHAEAEQRVCQLEHSMPRSSIPGVHAGARKRARHHAHVQPSAAALARVVPHPICSVLLGQCQAHTSCTKPAVGCHLGTALPHTAAPSPRNRSSHRRRSRRCTCCCGRTRGPRRSSGPAACRRTAATQSWPARHQSRLHWGGSGPEAVGRPRARPGAQAAGRRRRRARLAWVLLLGFLRQHHFQAALLNDEHRPAEAGGAQECQQGCQRPRHGCCQDGMLMGRMLQPAGGRQGR